jgi:hypothetical protein
MQDTQNVTVPKSWRLIWVRYERKINNFGNKVLEQPRRRWKTNIIQMYVSYVNKLLNMFST